MEVTKATEAGTKASFMTLLRRHRLSKGLSQTALAKKLGLKTSSTISFWETGESLPSPRLIPKLARILGIDAMTLTQIIEPDGERTTARPALRSA